MYAMNPIVSELTASVTSRVAGSHPGRVVVATAQKKNWSALERHGEERLYGPGSHGIMKGNIEQHKMEEDGVDVQGAQRSMKPTE